MKILGRKSTKYWVFILGIFLLITGVIISILIGAQEMGIKDIFGSLYSGNDINSNLVRDVRVPRALAAVFVGGFLAVSGAILQGITKNPIAEPSVMGLTQGATFAIAVAFVLQKTIEGFTPSSFTLSLFAFLGASISGIMVYIVCSRGIRKVNPIRLALAGTALGTLLISLATGITIYFNLSQQLGFWISGGLLNSTWDKVQLLVFVGGIALVFAVILAPKITILSLGEEVAIGLGEKTNLVRFLSLMVVIVLTGVSVSVAGNIIFVGLIIPQIVKALIGSDYRYIIPASMILGSVLLVYSDILARIINPPYETPIGSLTALLGVPVFIYLVRKGRS